MPPVMKSSIADDRERGRVAEETDDVGRSADGHTFVELDVETARCRGGGRRSGYGSAMVAGSNGRRPTGSTRSCVPPMWNTEDFVPCSCPGELELIRFYAATCDVADSARPSCASSDVWWKRRRDDLGLVGPAEDDHFRDWTWGWATSCRWKQRSSLSACARPKRSLPPEREGHPPQRRDPSCCRTFRELERIQRTYRPSRVPLRLGVSLACLDGPAVNSARSPASPSTLASAACKCRRCGLCPSATPDSAAHAP